MKFYRVSTPLTYVKHFGMRQTNRPNWRNSNFNERGINFFILRLRHIFNFLSHFGEDEEERHGRGSAFR